MEFLQNFGQRHTTESNGRSATFEVWKRKVFLVGTDTATLVETCHHTGPSVKKKKKIKKNKNNISQTCTICLWVCCWYNLRKSLHFFKTELQHNYTDLTGQNFTTAVALANTQWLPTCHVSSFTPSHQFHTALIFVKQNCNSLLMYVGCFFFSVLKEKRNMWNFVELQRYPFFALQTLTSLLYFFLLKKSTWLLYIVMTLMMAMITYLLAVQGALLPACVCMKGVKTVWPNRGCWWR